MAGYYIRNNLLMLIAVHFSEPSLQFKYLVCRHENNGMPSTGHRLSDRF